MRVFRTFFIINAIAAAGYLVVTYPRTPDEKITDVRQLLIAEALTKGATLVRCEHGVCHKDQTKEIVGYGPDGAYLSYPADAKTDAELAELSAQVKQVFK